MNTAMFFQGVGVLGVAAAGVFAWAYLVWLARTVHRSRDEIERLGRTVLDHHAWAASDAVVRRVEKRVTELEQKRPAPPQA